jgi:hypothetical protein
MKNKLIYPAVLMVVFAVACGGDEGRNSASQAAYETVQEGSASGVTSTIHGPGETLPPITGTNADTTTAFTINPNAVPPAGGAPATMAGTLPSTPVYGGSPSGGYSSPQPMTRSTTYSSSSTSSSSTPQQRQVYNPPSQPAPRPMQQQQSEPLQEQSEPVETRPTETAAAQPPQTNTNTAPPPQAQPQQSEPAPPTDEGGDDEAAEEPPPPPPPA